MKTIQLTIDSELGEEYCRKYREVYPDSTASNFDNETLLKESIRDRLIEEIDFLDDELQPEE